MQKATIIFDSLSVNKEKNYAMITAEGGERYSFFLTKKDGTDSKAKLAIKEINPQKGQPLNILYEVNGQYKNLGMVYRAGENDIPGDPQIQPEANASLENSSFDRYNELEKRIQELEKQVQGHGTLLVELRGKEAVDLHTSFGDDDIPIIDGVQF